MILYHLCRMPGARKLPPETAVKLVEGVMQIPMIEVSAVAGDLMYYMSANQLQRQGRVSPCPNLAPVHVKRLLALLQGPTAAAATAAIKHDIMLRGTPTIMVWLARQPGAAAAAAELGLTAADVPDPAAAALLFGGQHDEEDA
jgi:hypothetical protein